MKAFVRFILFLILLAIIFFVLVFLVPVKPFTSCKSTITGFFGGGEEEEAEKDEEVEAVKEYLVGNWGLRSYIQDVEGKPLAVYYVGDNFDGGILKADMLSIKFSADGSHEYIHNRGTVWYAFGDWNVWRNPNTQDIYVNIDNSGVLLYSLLYNKEDRTLSAVVSRSQLGAATQYKDTAVFQKLS